MRKIATILAHDREALFRNTAAKMGMSEAIECLALQGFPKEYRSPKIPMASAYKQCGNSVVVPVIRRIAENIMKAMSR